MTIIAVAIDLAKHVFAVHGVDECRYSGMLPGVEIRVFLGMKSACLHGSKRHSAALTAMTQRIAPAPRQWFASPG